MGLLKDKKNLKNTYFSISLLGKIYKLNINYFTDKKVHIIQGNNEINIFLPNEYKNKNNIEVINLSIKKIIDEVAEKEIENAMELIRHILKFAPNDYLVKRLNNEYYKASRDILLINPDLIQYNKEIIHTTLIQGFCKTQYRPNSNKYKELLNNSLEQYKLYTSKSDKIIKVS